MYHSPVFLAPFLLAAALSAPFALSAQGGGDMPAGEQLPGVDGIIIDGEAIAEVGSQNRGNRYSFGDYTWDQRNTPDLFEFISPGEDVGGAHFDNDAAIEASTHGLEFPNNVDGSGFNFLLCLGNRINYSEGKARSLNVPRGNLGMNLRSGFEVSWSRNRVLPNRGGTDLVIFESGDSIREPDAYMFRVRRSKTGEWTQWQYRAHSGFEFTFARKPQVIFMTEIDLSYFEIPPGETIDAIQVANMTAFDRIKVPSEEYAEGYVLFDQPNSNFAKPDPKTEFLNSFHERNLFDPDILYIAALHDMERTGDADEDVIDDFFR